jgi:hypothetical protein
MVISFPESGLRAGALVRPILDRDAGSDAVTARNVWKAGTYRTPARCRREHQRGPEMNSQIDRGDWRRAERFDVPLSLTIAVAMVLVAALASFV